MIKRDKFLLTLLAISILLTLVEPTFISSIILWFSLTTIIVKYILVSLKMHDKFFDIFKVLILVIVLLVTTGLFVPGGLSTEELFLIPINLKVIDINNPSPDVSYRLNLSEDEFKSDSYIDKEDSIHSSPIACAQVIIADQNIGWPLTFLGSIGSNSCESDAAINPIGLIANSILYAFISIFIIRFIKKRRNN